jgi:hypothetical protein
MYGARLCTMDSSANLGFCLALELGFPMLVDAACTVRVFQQKFTREDAIGSHTFAPLEALAGV